MDLRGTTDCIEPHSALCWSEGHSSAQPTGTEFAAHFIGAIDYMAKPRFLVSLTTNDNDYQQAQAQAAEEAARKLGVEAQIVYADNDAINQSTQILKAIQSAEAARPNGIVFEPVGGTALPQVAQVAATAGIGWAVLNRDAPYISELRKTSAAPVFGHTSDHVAIGRIQGRQFAALLPHGGSILYIQGPAENSAAKERAVGMQETKPTTIQATVLKAQWTEESSTRAVRSWLKLATARRAAIDLIGAQDDSMALGARKAFEGLTNDSEKERWLALPYTGCDGLPKTGQMWVRNGLLAATVYVPPNAGQALEMLYHALQSKGSVPERVLTVPVSIPPLSELKPATPRE
jgi:ribose transport system substrate-binding protein